MTNQQLKESKSEWLESSRVEEGLTPGYCSNVEKGRKSCCLVDDLKEFIFVAVQIIEQMDENGMILRSCSFARVLLPIFFSREVK